MPTPLAQLRQSIRHAHLGDDTRILNQMAKAAPVSEETRQRASAQAADLVREIRSQKSPGLMEVFLAEYGLSTSEGIALMCLAEALLRVPDASTIDALIEDKIAPSAWGEHLGHSSSPLVNASTWALMLTGKVLKDSDEGLPSVLRRAVKRLGEPVIRRAVQRAMKELGHQFVLGETISQALTRGRGKMKQGFTYSYDMLGEAALTIADAQVFLTSYHEAIRALAPSCTAGAVRHNPGVSVKLSALHPRYEASQSGRCVPELSETLLGLCRAAKGANMGLNIDAEESERLELSLDIIENVLGHPDLAGWDGFGVVVQAFGKRAMPVIDWLYALARRHDRKIMIRLVKGAYWDREIKRAQVEGLTGFPVFTSKPATDVAFIHCARHLLDLTDRIYPQFATHNAHTVAAVLAMNPAPESFEFQRLHGMGEALHDRVKAAAGTACRIYAPVGAHRDLLAYLVRRLLENGANSSFVNQIVDTDVPPEVVAADPFARMDSTRPIVTPPSALFHPRVNSRGRDIADPADLAKIEAGRRPFLGKQWAAGPILAAPARPGASEPVLNPADASDRVGTVANATPEDLENALGSAEIWDESGEKRAATLRRIADLYEENFGEFFTVLAREAGKTLPDCISELREAVDFLRYYADEIQRADAAAPRGIFGCISPWNFPLAIFTGQIAAALAAGNAVIAKPAETTPITAWIAIGLFHRAGVPAAALQLLPGLGPQIGAGLSADPRVAGLAFTGSTRTAQAINRNMADALDPAAPLIAETGGLNAMIVDSTALPEQAVRDILTSAFQSAGQRCSALRILYVQEDVAGPFQKMLFGAMDALTLGSPLEIATDVGPVITNDAQAAIQGYIDEAGGQGRLLKQLSAPKDGFFVGPAVIGVDGIDDLEGEVFGPVLHFATYKAGDLGRVVDTINARGFGLTFGMHSRIDDRVEKVTSRVRAGNIYINRNQIGAVVGSQPFGGEGLSGTGPKAGGPDYLGRFVAVPKGRSGPAAGGAEVDVGQVQAAIDALPEGRAPLTSVSLPGPTGESNRLSSFGRGRVLCLGPSAAAAQEQAAQAVKSGCAALQIAPGATGDFSIDGVLRREELVTLNGFAAVALWSGPDDMRKARQALARREGAILPLLAEARIAPGCRVERHVCIDTTAAGGNAALLAGHEFD